MNSQMSDEETRSTEEHQNEEDHSFQPHGENGEAAQHQEQFPIVGIGASAGGLKTFEQFFSNMPKDSGMAFVVVQHLAPHHESELAELVQNHTGMLVTQVEDQTEVQPDCVYVIPPGKDLEIRKGVLYLTEAKRERGYRTPINSFFRSLAEDQGENAVCIILSGTGSDGTQGLKAIKERAGITMAQSAEDAEYDGMPRSAIGTGLVDFTGTAAALAEKLFGYRKSASKIQLPDQAEALPEDDSEALSKIFTQLRSRTGHDFSHYKRSTILRRIGRRLQVNQIENLSEYSGYLRKTPEETDALFKDFLISVTNFFRDPDAFEALEKKVIPKLFEQKSSQNRLRVWLPGCATGEEAYSVAILLHEYGAAKGDRRELQIFATDIDEEAIAFAREGRYPDSIAADISRERLRRYFKEVPGGYRVKEEIRETVLFAVHNLIKDPPFSRLNFISCRNLLIYLNLELQERVFELFHYTLVPGGYLFLGTSDAANAAKQLFSASDRKHQLFRSRKFVSSPARLPKMPLVETDSRPDVALIKESQQKIDPIEDLYQVWTLKRYAPPRLLVNENYRITHVFAGAGRYLREQEGPVTQNILQKILHELRLELRTALYQAFHKKERTETRWLRTELDETTRLVRIKVGPIDDPNFPEEYAEIVFEEKEVAETPSSEIDSEAAESELVTRLEEELLRTRERLQTTIEEHETSNEELLASNEELQSMNEELQSTAEELETSKEELQSMNEELTTVNQELKNKIEELSQANSDLQNLMDSTDIGTIFVDRDLHVKRFTPSVKEIFNIINADIGRPLAHVSHTLDYKNLPEDAEYVLKSLEKVEREVQSSNDRWYVIRLTPYRTVQDKIKGIVINFVDVTSLKQSQEALKQRTRQQTAVAEVGHLALEGVQLDDLMQTASNRICETLDLECCKVLELMPPGDQLLLRAGQGWKEGYVGRAMVGAKDHSQASYTLQTDVPVIVEDLSKETRFTSPTLLVEHDVISGMSVIIPGLEQPFGVLGAHSKRVRKFTQDDASFLQAVANLLAEAIERQKVEEALHYSREQAEHSLAELQTIYTTAPIGLAVLDTNLRFLRVNDRLAEINGQSAADHLDQTVREVVPDLADTAEPLLRQVIETGEAVVEQEIRGVTPANPDQECVWLESYYPLTTPDGQIIGVNAVVQEITSRKQAEQALRESEERFRRAIVDAPFPIIMHNEDGEIVQLSNTLTELTGYTRAELKTIGDWTERAYSERQEVVLQDIERLYSVNHRMDEGEYVVTTKEGQQRVWNFSSAPLGKDEQGRRLVISMAADVTERNKAEEALRQSEIELRALTETLEQRVAQRTEELEHSMQELNQFAYAASHDLRTPLRAISHLAEWIVEDSGALLPESSKTHLNKLQSRIERMENLLDDLLAYSRADRDIGEVTEVETGDLVRNVISVLDPPEPFEVVIQKNMPTIVTARALLEIVFRNLIDNGIKHHDRADGQIEVSAYEEEEYIVFCVKDDGPGIAPMFHERIFQIFQTLQPRDRVEGSGMGLALVRKVVENRGGTVTVTSAKGQGSTFEVTWPKENKTSR